jgi:hypothetical protein
MRLIYNDDLCPNGDPSAFGVEAQYQVKLPGDDAWMTFQQRFTIRGL